MPEQLDLLRSPELEARFDAAYEAVLNQWPVPSGEDHPARDPAGGRSESRDHPERQSQCPVHCARLGQRQDSGIPR
jgi:hypothetical protein